MEKDRFHNLITNGDCGQETIYYFLTTSNIEHWNNCKLPEERFVYVPEDAIWFFPKATLIDCGKSRKIDRPKLKRKYNKGGLTFKGMIPACFMKKVIKLIEQSKSISNRDKELILCLILSSA